MQTEKEIIKFVKYYNVDLIIMSKRRKSEDSKYFEAWECVQENFAVV